jgi:hypothetical protein
VLSGSNPVQPVQNSSFSLLGLNFSPAAILFVNGSVHPFNWVSATQLDVPAGLAAGTYSVMVRNPGGLDSEVYILTVKGMEGPLEIDEHKAFPNPLLGARLADARIAVHLKGSAERLTLKIYTRAMVCVGSLEQGAVGPGWHRLPLPSEFSADAGNGTYFYVVSAYRRGEKTVQDAVGRITILR